MTTKYWHDNWMELFLHTINKTTIRTYLSYCCFGVLITCFLLATVHNRSTKEMQQIDIIQSWYEQGITKLGGMRIKKDLTEFPDQSVKVTIPQSFLFPSYIVQFFHHKVFGEFNPRLMGITNMLVVVFASAMLGMLIFKLLINSQLNTQQSFLLGGAAQLIFQTFPWNVVLFFRMFPIIFGCIFLLALMNFLQKELYATERHSHGGKVIFATALLFTLFDHIGAFFFVLATLFLLWQVKPQLLSSQTPRLLIAGWVTGWIIFKLQILYIRVRFPELEFTGASFLYRSGLDGSTIFYNGFSDIFTREGYRPSYMESLGKSKLLSDWLYLFVFSAAIYLTLAYRAIKDGKFINELLVVSIPLCAYLLFAFILGQAAITHPFVYDVYLLIPVLLCVFYVLPVLIVRSGLEVKIVTTALCFFAFGYSMVQLRDYAISFPLREGSLWLTFMG